MQKENIGTLYKNYWEFQHSNNRAQTKSRALLSRDLCNYQLHMREAVSVRSMESIRQVVAIIKAKMLTLNWTFNFLEGFHGELVFPAGTKPSESANTEQLQESRQVPRGLHSLIFRREVNSEKWFSNCALKLCSEKSLAWPQRQKGQVKRGQAEQVTLNWNSDSVWLSYLHLKKWVTQK